MGMFDEITCAYPLPGIRVEFGPEVFQTKDLDCVLNKYHIGATGVLFDPEGVPLDFTGTIEFYTSNWAGTADGEWYTPNGEDLESVTYEAVFIHGQIESIKQTEYSRKTAKSMKEWEY